MAQSVKDEAKFLDTCLDDETAAVLESRPSSWRPGQPGNARARFTDRVYSGRMRAWTLCR